MKPPAFQFYVDDFIGGTFHFSNAEVGLYIRLLCVQWSTGSIPNDDREISQYGKGVVNIARVKAKFSKCEDGLLRNERLEVERVKQQTYRESRSKNGKHGGRPCKPCANHMVLKTKAKKSSPVSSLQSPIVNNKVHFPSIDEVKLVVAKTGLPESDAVWFWNKCEGNGWTNGGKPIKSWQHVIASWKAAGYMPSQKLVNGQPQSKSLPLAELDRIGRRMDAEEERRIQKEKDEAPLDMSWMTKKFDALILKGTTPNEI